MQRTLKFNECLEIRWNTLHFLFCISSFKIILFENQYQTFGTEFYHEIKHLEVRRKYSTSNRIFNSLLSIWSFDEKVFLIFDP